MGFNSLWCLSTYSLDITDQHNFSQTFYHSTEAGIIKNEKLSYFLVSLINLDAYEICTLTTF